MTSIESDEYVSKFSEGFFLLGLAYKMKDKLECDTFVTKCVNICRVGVIKRELYVSLGVPSITTSVSKGLQIITTARTDIPSFLIRSILFQFLLLCCLFANIKQFVYMQICGRNCTPFDMFMVGRGQHERDLVSI